MARCTILLLSVIIPFLLSSQNNFQPGYWIDKEGNKSEGLINNLDWKYNPKNFEFKSTTDAETVTVDVGDCLEFGVNNKHKFLSRTVRIDRSSDQDHLLEKGRGPRWAEETLFLRVVLEGPTNLYVYEENVFLRFFYSTREAEIQQLIYKRFMVTTIKFDHNRDYIHQLLKDVNCKGADYASMSRIQYSLKSLSNHFQKNNSCLTGESDQSGSENETVIYVSNKEGTSHLSVRPGIDISSLNIKTSTAEYDFDQQTRFRLGIEYEYILNFQNDRWSILIEPTFQSFKSSLDYEVVSHVTFIRTVKVNYTSVDFPVGVRYYFPMSDDLNPFVNININPWLAMNMSSHVETSNAGKLDIDTKLNWSIGGGLFYKRYVAELRYNTKRDITNKQLGWNSDYSKVSVIIGYRIF